VPELDSAGASLEQPDTLKEDIWKAISMSGQSSASRRDSDAFGGADSFEVLKVPPFRTLPCSY
jgi:hypothetical protein